ncbi:MAG: biotin/lipoate A/B protein ligase family protein [Halobacteriaceae archaeon]
MTDLADREWRLIREEARSGPMNMALDEVAARTAADGGPRTVRVYAWAPGTLSLGYAQDPATVDWSSCRRRGIDTTRRPTGGGGIYHDRHGDISYAVIVRADEVPGDLARSYRLLLAPLLAALDDLGLDADFADAAAPALYEPACYLRALDPAHDLVAGGRKLCGNAQHRTRSAVVQHGSLSYALDPETHLATFSDPGVTPDEFRDRVTSVRRAVGVDRDETVAALEGALADWADASPGAWTDAELSAARELADRRYGDEAWVRHREDAGAEP